MPKDLGPWIQTFSCKRFHLLNPQPEDICIEDIAHALSMQPRFSGHTSVVYSVAQHSIEVYRKCYGHLQKFAGLMHDASEAYICDICAPLKHSGKMAQYIKVERKIQNAINKKFGLGYCDYPETYSWTESLFEMKRIDKRMCATEAVSFMSPLDEAWKEYMKEYPPYNEDIEPMTQKVAEREFLREFRSMDKLLPKALETVKFNA